jgi:hypothetical protein
MNHDYDGEQFIFGWGLYFYAYKIATAMVQMHILVL